MNYLGHAFLSFQDPEILLGNMISDYVKGKAKYAYPPKVLAGIDYHREIDAFTDNHPLNRMGGDIFRPSYRLYSNAFMDVVYDHFLAQELSLRNPEQFSAFVQGIYNDLEKQADLFPPVFANIFPYMKQHNWLYNYQYNWGIEKSMEGLVHRAKYLSDSETAFRLFTGHYQELNEIYQRFMPDLHRFSLKKFSDIH